MQVLILLINILLLAKPTDVVIHLPSGFGCLVWVTYLKPIEVRRLFFRLVLYGFCLEVVRCHHKRRSNRLLTKLEVLVVYDSVRFLLFVENFCQIEN